MRTLIYPLPTNKFVGYGTCPSYYFPMNEFMGWDIPFAGRTGTNEFVPYLIRHQNTYTPNATHDFNHGISAQNDDPLTPHDFSRGYYGVKNERVVTHEFIRGTINHNTIYATHSPSRSIGKFIRGFQEATCQPNLK